MDGVSNVSSDCSNVTKIACSDAKKHCNFLSGYVLLELSSLNHLDPLISSDSNKASAIDISLHFVTIGTVNGNVYVLPRIGVYAQSLDAVPVQVIHSDVYPVFKVAISPDENYLAVANRKGLLSVYRLSASGFAVCSVVYNCQCHCLSEEVNFVTTLCWTQDCSKVYAGDRKGRISCTFIEKQSNSPSTEVLLETDSEIVQIEIYKSLLLVSTLTRSCIYDLETLNFVQIGKKLRYGYYGCAFGHELMAKSSTNDSSCHHQNLVNDSDISAFVCCPNGKIWKSNKLGVVLRTYQYHELLQKANVPLVSYRNSFLLEPKTSDDTVYFKLLHHLNCDSKQFMLLNGTSKFYIVNPQNGELILHCDVNACLFIYTVLEDFDECTVCGAMIFTLSLKTGAMRQYMVLKIEEAVHLLCMENLFTQAAGIITLLELSAKSNARFSWSSAILRSVIKGLKGLDIFAEKKSTCISYINTLHKILKLKNDQLLSDIQGSLQSIAIGTSPTIDTATNKSDSDFSPSILQRCNSAPEISRVVLTNPLIGYPCHRCHSEVFPSRFINFPRAANGAKKKSSATDAESLKFILNYGCPVISFEPQMTLSNVSRELSAAENVFETLTSRMQMQKKPLVKESALSEVVIDVSGPEINVKRLNFAKKVNCGPRIAKVVRPVDRQTSFKSKAVLNEVASVDVSSSGAASSFRNHEYASNSNICLVPSSDKNASMSLRLVPTYATVSNEKNSALAHWRCIKCGLHKSWSAALTFGPVMKNLNVLSDHFRIGGVPVTIEEWNEFFDGYLLNKVCVLHVEELCRDCTACFEFGNHLKNKKKLILQLNARRQKLVCEVARDQKYARDSVLSLKSDVIYNLFFKQTRLSSEISSTVGTGDSMNADAKNEGKTKATKLDNNNKKQWFLKHFSPLLSLQLIQLINCMRLCQGMEDVLSFLSTHKLRNYLTQDDWQWLVVLKACHMEKWKKDFPSSFVSSVLSECNLDSIVKFDDVTTVASSSSEKFVSRSRAKNVIFLATGCCPFCTLPLKTIVSDTESSVVVFSCGHAYHKVCLFETNLNHCVRCELERHRLRKQAHSTSSRSASSSYSSLVRLTYICHNEKVKVVFDEEESEPIVVVNGSILAIGNL
uniref:RING-type domain-containing protein n=1 Tax=Syphacia muris TaxID=451379 RepID=A0A0N5AWS4_9BILA